MYASIGFEPIKNLSLGVTANFNFGTLEYERIQSVEGVQFGTLDNRESKINGYDFNYALNYNPTIKDKYTLYTSVLVNTQGNLISKNTQTLGSFSLSNGNNVEVVDVDLDASNLRNTELKVPTRTTVGLGFGENKKWFLGAEYSFQQLSDFDNRFLGLENVSNLNLGFELGKRGTTDANLIEESYFKVNVGLSLNDRWFQQRKIN